MIQQGHKYLCHLGSVLALESADGAEPVKVAAINYGQPYPLGPAEIVIADELTPMPMRYFHDQVPA